MSRRLEKTLFRGRYMDGKRHWKDACSGWLQIKNTMRHYEVPIHPSHFQKLLKMCCLHMLQVWPQTQWGNSRKELGNSLQWDFCVSVNYVHKKPCMWKFSSALSIINKNESNAKVPQEVGPHNRVHSAPKITHYHCTHTTSMGEEGEEREKWIPVIVENNSIFNILEQSKVQGFRTY
jgi:hypothetical protein